MNAFAMKIKKLFCILPVIAVSCTSEPLAEQRANMADIRFTIDDSAVSYTKSTSSNSEGLATDIQIAVYAPSGQLYTSGEITGNSLTLSVPVEIGGYSVAALVNGTASLGSCVTFDKTTGLLSALTSNGLSNNELEMFGSVSSQTFHAGKSCTVPVTRIPAKVEIDKIVNMIPSKPDFTVKSVYLINVNTSSSVTGVVSSAVWKQQRKYVSTETDVVRYTYDAVGSKLDYGKSYETPHYFYCYANPTTSDTSSPTWSPRYTRLVVEADYNGHTCYYPINIVGAGNVLLSGYKYVITQLTITGPGSDDPDVPISRTDASFNVSVQDWGNGFSQTINY